MAKKEFLDFKKIKRNADCLKVIERIGLLDRLTGKGNGEYAGWCPFGDHGKESSFSINVDKEGAYECKACKRKGSIIDIVNKILDLDDLRDAATYVRDVSSGDDDDKAMDAVSQEKEVDDVDSLIAEMTNTQNCSLVAVMTLGEALRRIKSGDLEKGDVRVVDMRTLRYVDTVVENQTKRANGT